MSFVYKLESESEECMRKSYRGLMSLGCASAMLLNSLTAVAQTGSTQPAPPPSRSSFTISQEGSAGSFVLIDQDGTRQTGPAGEISFIPGIPVGEVGVGGNFSFASTEMSFDGKVVKGAPYSAEAVTEVIQTLGDGNRIVRRSSTQIFRDSEGRTRREQNMAAIGPFVTADQGAQRIYINDPVESVNYILDPRAQSAQKMTLSSIRAIRPMMAPSVTAGRVSGGGVGGGAVSGAEIKVSGGVLQGSATNRVQPAYPPIAKAAGASGPVHVQITLSETGKVVEAQAISGHPLLRDAALAAARQWEFKPVQLSGNPVRAQGVLTFNFALEGGAQATTTAIATPAAGVYAATAVAAPTAVLSTASPTGVRVHIESRKEELGKQIIEGVEAEGTRTIATIPAGAIGNERPIDIISERWYSAELQTVVLSRHLDPRSGETVYRLTNISRTEQPANLFQVPSDYTIRDTQTMRRQTEEQLQQMRRKVEPLPNNNQQ
jgi:TonB family protein